MRGNKLLCNNVAGRKISITQTLTHHGSQSALLAAKVPGGGATQAQITYPGTVGLDKGPKTSNPVPIIGRIRGCRWGSAHLTLWQGHLPRLIDCAAGTGGRSGREGLKPF